MKTVDIVVGGVTKKVTEMVVEFSTVITKRRLITQTLITNPFTLTLFGALKPARGPTGPAIKLEGNKQTIEIDPKEEGCLTDLERYIPNGYVATC